jgi:hypothetical protein
MATKTKPKKHGHGQAAPVEQVIEQAARRWHIPLWALLGVKLSETGNGGPGTANPFQIEPGTARSLGVRDVNNFAEATNGAAKLLSQYRRKYGSWNAAFEAYNGGPGAVGKGYAYNEAHVKGKLAEFGIAPPSQVPASFLGGIEKFGREFWEGFTEIPKKLFHGEVPVPRAEPGSPVQKGAQALGGGAGEIFGGLSSVGSFFSMLLSVEFWIRVGEVLAGAILLYMGLKNLTGVGVSDLPGARTARVAVLK